MKKHHKLLIGGFSSVVIIALIIMAILLNALIVKQSVDYNILNSKINNLQIDTQSKLNELTENILQTKTSVEQSQEALEEKITLLKASAGEDFSGIIEDSIPSVVTIRTDIGQGTGFIIEDRGYIITNAHVLSGGQYIQAITSNQKIIDALLIGYNANLDLALLKIPGDYNSLELADSEDIQIGEKVIAIGNPLGLQFSVSQGIVSAVHRMGINNLEAYIQTDTPLNPGNSGGPLINKQGEVIGINNFKIGDSESLGFALESNYVKETINDISQQELNMTLIS